jgi:hypothetical protein
VPRRKYWIQEAIKRPGSLKRWLKEHKSEIKRATGMEPFTRRGTVNIRALQKLRNTSYYEKLPTRVKQKINLAITLRKLRRR